MAAQEEDILNAVLEYAQSQAENGNDNETELLNELLLYVRFPYIQSQRLIEDVEKNPKVANLNITKDLLYETYRYNFYRRFYDQVYFLFHTRAPRTGHEF